MRCPLGVLFLASCTMLTPEPAGEKPVEQAPATREESRTNPPDRKPKSRQAPPSGAEIASPGAEVSSCANLDAGDLKETIKAKLDCLEKSAK